MCELGKCTDVGIGPYPSPIGFVRWAPAICLGTSGAIGLACSEQQQFSHAGVGDVEHRAGEVSTVPSPLPPTNKVGVLSSSPQPVGRKRHA